MGPRFRIFLTRKQEKKLLKLRTEDLPQKVKDRPEVISFLGMMTIQYFPDPGITAIHSAKNCYFSDEATIISLVT
ncbi:hypothetical protein Tery_0605 [Trichodesmium erythraeum IMS101]|uniref:Uncharacterized protein n=1 Tax=Trichodesmium erythraeum (strain IMS101) TaxID=203124 RepID=Q118M5_TRIEI|nr:hypothetical protein [Trichodesmium erythraeum GBRTRLIN201]MCH2049830.1 hypothetical protein [Trichodesmium sp. ALOHA_ZT_67]